MIVQAEITRAAQHITAYGSGASLTTAELADGLTAHNAMVRGWFSVGLIGPPLISQPVTATTVVDNGGLYQAGKTVATLSLPAAPKSGTVFGVAMLGTAATTLNPNGALINGSAASVVLNATTAGGTWFWRDDVGEWRKAADQALADEIYFPAEIQAWMPWMLAAHMAAEYGEALSLSATVKENAAQGQRAVALRYGYRPVQ